MTSSHLQSIAIAVAVMLGLAIIVIGLRFLIAPVAAASAFGVPAPPGHSAYLMAKGLRDIVLGLSGLTLISLGYRHAAGWFLAVVAVVPIGDAFIVVAHGGSAVTALGVHGATAVALVVVGVTLITRDSGRRGSAG